MANTTVLETIAIINSKTTFIESFTSSGDMDNYTPNPGEIAYLDVGGPTAGFYIRSTNNGWVQIDG